MSDTQVKEVQHAEAGASVVRVVVDSGKHANLSVICAIVCGATLILSFWAWKVAYDSQTEARLVEYYLMDPHSRTPDELAAWVKFQKEHERGK